DLASEPNDLSRRATLENVGPGSSTVGSESCQFIQRALGLGLCGLPQSLLAATENAQRTGQLGEVDDVDEIMRGGGRDMTHHPGRGFPRAIVQIYADHAPGRTDSSFRLNRVLLTLVYRHGFSRC